MDETVTSRLEEKDILLLDKLIKMGYFSNRSEAIRSIVSKGLREIVEKQLKGYFQKELELEPKLTEEELMEYGKKLFPLSVAEIVAEGRER